jgi:hypothetical protein
MVLDAERARVRVRARALALARMRVLTPLAGVQPLSWARLRTLVFRWMSCFGCRGGVLRRVY